MGACGQRARSPIKHGTHFAILYQKMQSAARKMNARGGPSARRKAFSAFTQWRRKIEGNGYCPDCPPS
jgi:hypothetical protein